jgi:hypothetical protein
MRDDARMADESNHLRCVCGGEMTGAEGDVVVAAIEHGLRVHNMRATREEVLALIVREPAPPVA